MQEKKKKVIYCYCNAESKKPIFKIGKADQRVDHFRGENESLEEFLRAIAKRRIKEQQTAATFGELKLVHLWDISDCDDSTEVEHAIHEAIKAAGHERQDRIDLDGKKGTTEWFEFVNFG